MEGRQETETWIDMTCRVEVEYLFSGLWMGKGEGGAEREREEEKETEKGRSGERQKQSCLSRGRQKESKLRTEAEDQPVSADGEGVGVAGLLKRQNNHYTIFLIPFIDKEAANSGPKTPPIIT